MKNSVAHMPTWLITECQQLPSEIASTYITGPKFYLCKSAFDHNYVAIWSM